MNSSSFLSTNEIAFYLSKAYILAQESKDPSTQNGALVLRAGGNRLSIIGSGVNALPKGVQDFPERWERPLKYQVVEHAERNAIFDSGSIPNGAIMVAPWAACADCARAIIQSGISVLVRHKQASDRSPANWKESIGIADTMLQEAGVDVVDYDGVLNVGGEHFRLLHTGELWRP